MGILVLPLFDLGGAGSDFREVGVRVKGFEEILVSEAVVDGVFMREIMVAGYWRLGIGGEIVLAWNQICR